MSASVRISRKAAKALLWIIEERAGVVGPSVDELRAALKPSVKHLSFRKARETAKKSKAAHRKRGWSAVRAAVAKRANLVCECGCERWFRGFGGSAQPDHFEGRARSESVETVWMIRADCHEDKGHNRPSAAHWLRKFITHAEKHCYAQAAADARDRLHFVETRAAFAGVTP